MSMTKELLLQLFDYKNGELYWKAKKSGVTVGMKAGSDSGNGYITLQINGKNYKLHRIIFMMHYGYLPKYLDHIDGNPSNNSIENLRECTHQENVWNQSIKKNNTTGIKNVSWSEKRKRWFVKLTHKTGTFQKFFKDLELAELVAIEARDKFHGKFANHGSIA